MTLNIRAKPQSVQTWKVSVELWSTLNSFEWKWQRCIKLLNIFGHEIDAKMKEETFLFFLPFIVPQQGRVECWKGCLLYVYPFGAYKIMLNCIIEVFWTIVNLIKMQRKNRYFEQKIAEKGEICQSLLKTHILSIMKLNAPSTMEVLKTSNVYQNTQLRHDPSV